MERVAVLGLGAMGSRVARNLLRAGHAVSVYNRSPERARELEGEGALVAPSPREAAAQAEVVMAMLTDDRASRAVWLEGPDAAIHGLKAGTVAVESSTVTPGWVLELAAQVAARGAEFLDAPVVGSRPQAEAGQLIYLVGGEAATLERARPAFTTTCANIHHVGAAGQGAALKLAVNALFGVQVAALGELLAMLGRAGVSEERAAAIFGELPVTSPAAKGALASVVGRRFAPMFPIDLVEKDFRYALEAAAALGAELPTTEAVRAVFARARQAGYGGDNITGVARLFLE